MIFLLLLIKNFITEILSLNTKCQSYFNWFVSLQYLLHGHQLLLVLTTFSWPWIRICMQSEQKESGENMFCTWNLDTNQSRLNRLFVFNTARTLASFSPNHQRDYLMTMIMRSMKSSTLLKKQRKMSSLLPVTSSGTKWMLYSQTTKEIGTKCWV
jgi:hypothetical protein